MGGQKGTYITETWDLGVKCRRGIGGMVLWRITALCAPSFCHAICSQMETASAKSRGQGVNSPGAYQAPPSALWEGSSALIKACYKEKICHLTIVQMRRMRHR